MLTDESCWLMSFTFWIWTKVQSISKLSAYCLPTWISNCSAILCVILDGCLQCNLWQLSPGPDEVFWLTQLCLILSTKCKKKWNLNNLRPIPCLIQRPFVKIHKHGKVNNKLLNNLRRQAFLHRIHAPIVSFSPLWRWTGPSFHYKGVFQNNFHNVFFLYVNQREYD